LQCPQCSHENPADSRFCLECGGALGLACPSCGAELPAGSKFCNQCGQATGSEAPAAAPAASRAEQAPSDYTPRHLVEKILHSRDALQGERKQVTVLFADVRGSMELSEGVDPEDWHHILDRFFQILADGVHRFEGTVNQYTGDGIMALFGAPIAHEDHAHRACWAALHLRSALGAYSDELRVQRGLDFSVRLGINSGEVVVGKIGDDLRMDYTAQGQTVGLAARMEHVAAANTVTLSGETARLVEGWFELRSLGETDVKGVSQPVPVFELEKAGAFRTRLDASRARGFSKFVGRGDELRTLQAAYDRAAAGDGEMVGVVANAGVGKSRLCVEFLEDLQARGVPIRTASCMPHGRLVPLLPVMELLRGFFEIGDDDSPQAARNKIAGALLLLDRELEPSLPLIFELLGVPDAERPAPELADDIRERRMFDIVRRVIRARSEKEPGVILIEDLHWIDPASEAFIQHLIDVVPDTRTLLLLNFRPEYRADWMQRSTYRQLPLRPLGREEVDELLRDLLGPAPDLVPLGERIRERTAGNPFFIEELVRHLADDGRLQGVRGSYTPAGPIEEVEIPPTVQPLLAARIDRLAEREKQVLQAASVLGDQSSESVLRDVLDLGEEELGDALRDLVTGEFLRETALYPEPEYDFLHPLTAEVAYGAQLSDHRARLHGRAARALEARTDEKSRSERAPLLAHHWDAAGETLKAARWHGLAADRMGGAHVPECHRHWSRVRELADTLPDDEEARNLGTMARIQLFVTGARVGRPEEEMEQLFRECSEIVGSGNDAFRARLLTAYSFYRMFVTANVAEAQDLALEARKLAERAGDPVLELGTRFALCNTYAGSDVTAALETAESTLEMLRRDPLLEGTMLPGSIRADVVFRFVRVVTQHMAGQLSAAGRTLEELKDLGSVDDYASVLAHTAARMLAQARGDAAAAEREAVLGHEAAEAMGSLSQIVTGLAGTGEALSAQGRYDEALDLFERALRLHRERRVFRQTEPLTLFHLGRLRLLRGEPDQAVAVSRECIAFTRPNGLVVGEACAHLLLAEGLLARDGAPAAGEATVALDRSEALFRQVGHGLNLPEVHRVRARIAEVVGDTEAHDRELAEALRGWDEMGAPLRAQRLRERGAAAGPG
jgi:class 3 adenylate cyclase/tetratricopeptide (TPR) repeat protein